MSEKITRSIAMDGYLTRADGMSNPPKSQIPVRPPPPAPINVKPAPTATAATPSSGSETK